MMRRQQNKTSLKLKRTETLCKVKIRNKVFVIVPANIILMHINYTLSNINLGMGADIENWKFPIFW